MSVGSVCPNCGARGDYHDRDRCSWTHVAERGEPGPSVTVVPVAAAAWTDDEICRAVLAALPGRSANDVASRVSRQRALVLEAIRDLLASGQIVKTPAGLERRRTLVAPVEGNTIAPVCGDGRSGDVNVGDDRSLR